MNSHNFPKQFLKNISKASPKNCNQIEKNFITIIKKLGKDSHIIRNISKSVLFSCKATTQKFKEIHLFYACKNFIRISSQMGSK